MLKATLKLVKNVSWSTWFCDIRMTTIPPPRDGSIMKPWRIQPTLALLGMSRKSRHVSITSSQQVAAAKAFRTHSQRPSLARSSTSTAPCLRYSRYMNTRFSMNVCTSLFLALSFCAHQCRLHTFPRLSSTPSLYFVRF